jgi:hypothetical protein
MATLKIAKPKKGLRALLIVLVAASTSRFAWSVASPATTSITFESPAYTNGNIVGQDGWNDPLTAALPGVCAADKIDVVDSKPISGAQSLHVSGVGAGVSQSVISKPIGLPVTISCLVRVDASGATGDFECIVFGSDFSTPIDIIFHHSGKLQYYVPIGNQPFPGEATFTRDTVYRVELTDIDYTANTFSAAIINTSDNATIASAKALPFACPPGEHVEFGIVFRNTDASSSAMIDDIKASAGAASRPAQ